MLLFGFCGAADDATVATAPATPPTTTAAAPIATVAVACDTEDRLCCCCCCDSDDDVCCFCCISSCIINDEPLLLLLNPPPPIPPVVFRFFAAPCTTLGLSSPLIKHSNSSKSGNGLASGGTAPGSVVMALKCANTARAAIVMKSVRWKVQPNVSCVR